MTTSQQRPMGRHHAIDPTSVPQQRPEPGFAPPQHPRYAQAQYGYAPQQGAAPYGAPRFDGRQYPAQPYVAPQYVAPGQEQPTYAGAPSLAQPYIPGQFAGQAAGQPSIAAPQVPALQPAGATASGNPTDAVPPATPSKPAKKRRKWPFVVAGIVLLLVIISLVNGGGTPPATPAAAPAAVPTAAPAPAAQAPVASSGKDVITYEVTGPSKAGNVTYVKDSNLGQEQVNGTSLPWSKTVEFDSGPFSIQPLSLVAQSGTGGSGEIKCRILRNGQELTSSTSSGPYAVVTCSAS